MSQIPYESLVSQSTDNRVKMFSLSNDNDEAIVRFMYNSPSDFDIFSVHDVTSSSIKFAEVNCLRTPTDPIDKCPLCNANCAIKQRFYIRLIEYVKNQDGSITPTPRVWNRSTAYAIKLKSYMDNYGPISDIICKVIRHGKAGDMKTTYEIIPNLNKTIYRDDVYVKDTSLCPRDIVDRFIWRKSPDEMERFINTGSFADTVSTEPTSTVNTKPVSSVTAEVLRDDDTKMPWETSSTNPAASKGNIRRY